MAHHEEAFLPEGDLLWYKDAIIYELHVRAFYDSDADGIGDFRGLTEKLDYLQDLGVTAIWLLPFYPSPLKDDGYDIGDYTDVHPSYGTLADFQLFLREAHRRDLKVITELVVNHTSDQHPWFQRARHAKKGSRYRDFYVWSDTPDKYKEARIIFKDFETSNWSWDPVAQQYYWHRFYSHQPDLNYDNPQVARAVFQVMDYWLAMGVDGLRLDAVPYLLEREGTTCENLPETHEVLKQLRRHIDQKFPGRMLLAEANQWPGEASDYFGQGDECNMAFHFPLMPRLFMSIRMEDRFPILEILRQTPQIPENCQWAVFLRNHDELTLEMVTDEERDYMYRVYAHDPRARINLGIRRRLAPLLANNRRSIELMKGLLFSLTGTPVIYYGDEILMGDNIYLGDRNGVRTPMQWSSDRNAGFSRANPQRLYLPPVIDPEYHYETANVEAQQGNPSSMLWWMKRLIALRKRYKAFGRGSLEFLHPENSKVLVFLRRYQDETIMVIANLSRFVQAAELDLSEFKNRVPMELFGRTRFPPIGELPYFITLGPHAFYWFSLEPLRVEVSAPRREGTPMVSVIGNWEDVFRGRGKVALEALLPDYMRARRWFSGKGRSIQAVGINSVIPVSRTSHGLKAYLAMVRVEYVEGEPETYALPLAYAEGEHAERIAADNQQPPLARVEVRLTGQSGLLYDALREKEFCDTLLDAMSRRRHFRGSSGELAAWSTSVYRDIKNGSNGHLEPSIMRAEQSNSSVNFGDRFIMKLFRRPEAGLNPDLEIGRFLTERTSFKHLAPVAGALEYRRERSEPATLAILQAYIPNEGDAWQYTMDALGRYFEHALVGGHPPDASLLLSEERLIDLSRRDMPDELHEMIGPYAPSAELLGIRTAQLHLALASAPDDPNFAPEPFTSFYQRSLYQSMRTLTGQVLRTLRQSQRKLPESARADSQRLLQMEGDILRRFRDVVDRKIEALRIRIHGDYHLGQVLYTGNDFVIIDFEGEPARPLGQRRLKRSPLVDVAGMLRSFHYVSHSALFSPAPGTGLRPEDQPALEPWAKLWYRWVGATYLKAYLKAAAGASFLPRTDEELRVLLDSHLLEKAIYELGYELNNRPDWVRIPLQGILELMQGEEERQAAGAAT